MASIISAGTTSGTSLNLSADTSGQLELKTGSGSTTAITISSAQLTTIANDATISGLTVGKGLGSVVTNTAVGVSALGANTSGLANTAMGAAVMVSNTTGGYNSAYGRNALGTNTTGSNNTALGYNALVFGTTGGTNTAVGDSALFSNTTADNNTAVGYQAGFSNTTGTITTAIGRQALYANTTGTNNTALGYAMVSNTTGSNNTGIGLGALQSNTTASQNTALGKDAGYTITTGGNNICIGYQAGYGAVGLTTGSGNTLIGYGASTDAAADTNELVILAGTNTTPKGKGSNTGFIFVNNGSSFGGIYQGNNSASWTTTSDRRLKKNIVDNTTGLELINQIRVRNFEYRLPEEVTELDGSNAIDRTGVQLGVIAQEIAEVSSEFVKTESTGVMSVDSDNLTWYLINAVKELKAIVDAQAVRIAELEGAK
jgi:hypothetical protein